jgi:DNA mismatch endonuclease, patch repair protein
MRANRRRDTSPERLVRSRLHEAGFRYRVDYPIRPDDGRLIRPDLVFTRKRVAVFIDGCFWHGCQLHGNRTFKRNSHYWAPKIARNQQRDESQVQRLRSDGWTVLRFWEHETPEAIAQTIAANLADPPAFA